MSQTTVNIQPLKELDSINQMLISAGSAPISSLDTANMNKNIDAIQARNVLMFVSREVQSEGWHFNTEHNCTLLPGPATGRIVLPHNVIRFDISPYSDPTGYMEFDIVQRDGCLYDMNNHTFDFTDRSVKASITYFLPFEHLPDTARIYITIKASRRFRMMVTGGGDNASTMSREDEARARAALLREHTTGQDRNFIDPVRRNSTVGLSSISRVLQRRL